MRVMFTSEIRIREVCEHCDFICGMADGALFSVSETFLIFTPITVSKGLENGKGSEIKI